MSRKEKIDEKEKKTGERSGREKRETRERARETKEEREEERERRRGGEEEGDLSRLHFVFPPGVCRNREEMNFPIEKKK